MLHCSSAGSVARILLAVGGVALGLTIFAVEGFAQQALPLKPAQSVEAQKVAPKPAKNAATALPPQGEKKPARAAGAQKLMTSAQKVPPAARMAASIAAATGQLVPPDHFHVTKPSTEPCPNPDALGTSSIMQVDTDKGLYVGMRYRTTLPLADKEVVLTFDDGPLPRNNDKVLAALEHECVKATFFIVGTMAKAYPEQLRKTAVAGHTIAYHTMTHPLDMVKRPLDWAQGNIRSGWQVVDEILYGQAGAKPATPFFRYPGLFNSRPINEWLNGMNVGVFAADAVGNDWVRGYDAAKVMNFALSDLQRAGNKGILLLHDTKDATAAMLPQLLRELKARGFKIVHVVPKTPPPPLVAAGYPVSVSLPQANTPLGERNLAGYDTGRQLQQDQQGRSGKTSDAPLPSYNSAALNEVVARAPEKTHAEQGWFATTANSFRGLGAAIGLW